MGVSVAERLWRQVSAAFHTPSVAEPPSLEYACRKRSRADPAGAGDADTCAGALGLGFLLKALDLAFVPRSEAREGAGSVQQQVQQPERRLPISRDRYRPHQQPKRPPTTVLPLRQKAGVRVPPRADLQARTPPSAPPNTRSQPGRPIP